MTPTPVPPTFAETLLRVSVRDAEWRDAVIGDLREELAAVHASRGPAAARRWYWRQAVPLACRFAVGRVVPAWRPARRRLAVADIEQHGGAVVRAPYNDAHERRAVVYDNKGNGLVFYAPTAR